MGTEMSEARGPHLEGVGPRIWKAQAHRVRAVTDLLAETVEDIGDHLERGERDLEVGVVEEAGEELAEGREVRHHLLLRLRVQRYEQFLQLRDGLPVVREG